VLSARDDDAPQAVGALGALGLVVLVWRIDLTAVQLALFHVGWGWCSF